MKLIQYVYFIFAVSTYFLILAPSEASSYPWQWGEGSGTSDGASRDYYDQAALFKWQQYLGDWVDENDTPYGTVAFATAPIIDNDSIQIIALDLTSLANEWVSGTRANNGILLKNNRGGPFNFRSREYDVVADQPVLEIIVNGQTTLIPAQADTFLAASTYQSQGTLNYFRLRNDMVPLLRFDLSGFEDMTLSQVTLKLLSYAQYGGGEATISVFAVPADRPPDETIQHGIAAQYDNDADISNHSNVYFATGFEDEENVAGEGWTSRWTSAGGNIDLVADSDAYGFSSLNGKALRTVFETGALQGMSVRYKFQDKHGSEPEEIYFRYYLRLGNDWNQTVQGGKLPGIAGTYGQAGWGGRTPDGTDGWSARGLFKQTISAEGNALEGMTPIGSYIYHVDQAGEYGDSPVWSHQQRGYVTNDQWYCIEQYVKMNTPGQKDGTFKAWVDGELAYERTDYRFRMVNTLKIEEIWMNFYHGGKIPSPFPSTLM